MDTSKMTTAELKAEAIKLMREHVTYVAEVAGAGAITMTDATEAIWGTSGRGNPKAVRIIETLGDWGYLKIVGKARRVVSVTDKGRELVGHLPVVGE